MLAVVVIFIWSTVTVANDSDTSSNDSSVITELIRDLSSKRKGAAQRAAEHLAEIGAPAVPFLLDVLRQGDQLASTLAGIALGHIGAEAVDALPALTEILRQDNGFSGFAAAHAAAKLGAPGVHMLVALLEQDPSPRVRTLAAAAGLMAAPDALVPAAVPILAHALGDPSDDVRLQAAESLNAIGEPAVAALRKKLRIPTLPSDARRLKLWLARLSRQRFPNSYFY